jgi:hypothetical protein
MSTDKSPKSMSAGATDKYSEGGMSHAPNSSANLKTRHHLKDIAVSNQSDDVTRAFGTMKFDHGENQIIYFGGSHWISIMSEVYSDTDPISTHCY